MPRSFIAKRTEAVRRFSGDFLREGGLRLVIAIASFVLVAGVAFSLLEAHGRPAEALAGLGDAIWWAFVTVATVGYGDITPHTTGGRVLAIALMFSGVVFLSLITATIASVLVERKSREGKGLGTTDFSRHVVICGWNDHGAQVLERLTHTEGDAEVVLVSEIGEEDFAQLRLDHPGLELFFVRGDFTHENVLKRAGVEQARCAIILSDTSAAFSQEPDDRAALGAMAMKSFNPDILISAEIQDSIHAPHLRRAMVDEIVAGGDFTSHMLVSAVLSPGVSQVMNELISAGGPSLSRRRPPAQLVGRSFRELFDHYRQQGLLALGLVAEVKQVTLEEMLKEGSSFIEEFVRDTFKEAEMEEYLSASHTKPQVELNPPDSRRITDADWAIVISR